MKPITKAIIPVAGWGTRMLPITKAIEKCMLPIGNRPIVDYLVQDCVKAGITEIIFVVGEQSTQLRQYYSRHESLENYLEVKKSEKLDLIKPTKNVTFQYVVQPTGGKYGTAVPVALASDLLTEEESAVVIMGDNFFYNDDGSSDIARLIQGTPEGQAGILAAVLADDDDITDRYGSIEVNDQGNLIRITEYPDELPVPFNKNVSMYVLNPALLAAIRQYVNSNIPLLGSEYGVFDSFESVLGSGGTTMKVISAQGKYLDGGFVQGWLHANNVVLGQ